MAAGLLIIPQFMPARNLAGASVAAEMVFYLADTSDLEPTYTDNTLAVAHPSPLQSDASGYFPVIWADTSKVFDVGFAKDNGEPPLTVTGVSPGTSLTAASAQQASDAATAANVAKEAAEDAQAATEALYGDVEALDDAVEAAETARDQAVQAAQASGGIPLNIPWSDKSAAYTVLVADAGKAFDLTGAFTLTLSAAATLAADFTFAVRNSGTGVWTIDPNGAELIDGLSTLKVYPGESFLVSCTGSGFRCIGRLRGALVLAGRQVVSGTPANINFTTELADAEFEAFVLEIDGASADGGTPSLRAQVDTGSGYAAVSGHKLVNGSSSSDSNGQLSAASPANTDKIQVRAEFALGGVWHSRTVCVADTSFQENRFPMSASAIGLRIVFSTNNLDAGTFRLFGLRKAA